MERIETTCAINTMQKIDTETSIGKDISTFYRIKISDRENRYDARISLPILKGGVNPRVRASSSVSREQALLKLLDNIKKELIQAIDQNCITSDNLVYILDNISISIKKLDLQSNFILTCFYNLVSDIHSYLNNPQLVKNMLVDSQNNNIANHENKQVQSNNSCKSFKEVAINWFKYKESLTVKTDNNPRPLGRKTLQGYNKTMILIIIPFFSDTNINDITDDDLQSCIDNTNGPRNKEAVYVVLKMIMDYAKKNNDIDHLSTLKKPASAPKNSKFKIEGHDFVYIESNRQGVWLDCLEKENTDVSLLFEGMLLEGFRPEEACGLTWNCLVEDATYFIVKNAYKDFPIYNEFAEVIGHIREYDDLKTDESYRKIPVHPRYKDVLLRHKEEQKKLFKKLHLEWSEHTPIFLNRYHKPYVPENLPKCLTSFRNKYSLEYLTPYGFRHSFATFLSEHGMRDIVLMKLMGHADFATTLKYYIFVSDLRKKNEYEQAWNLNSESNVQSQQFNNEKNISDDTLKKEFESFRQNFEKAS